MPRYCIKLLTNKKPEINFENEVDTVNKLHEVIMHENDKEPIFTEEDFNKIVESFKKKGKASYDFLTKSGKGFRKCVFQICSKVLNSEDLPLQWDNTVLV